MAGLGCGQIGAGGIDAVLHTDLEITLASAQQEPTLANLFQLYFHELSDFLDEEVDEDGLFDAWDESTFTTDGSRAYLLRVGGNLAGFLIVEMAQTPLGVLTEFADIFLLRRYRRRGLALEVVRRVMLGAAHPWLVAVFREDQSALAFWRSAFTRLPFTEVQEFGDPEQPEFFFFAVHG
jgi:predicted acetyltransferase